MTIIRLSDIWCVALINRGMTVMDDSKNRIDGAAPKKLRLDKAELKPPVPHAFQLPDISDIRRLAKWLDRDDLTLNEFGEKLARYPGLSRYVIAVANFRAVDSESMIREPVHASAYLGINGLQRVFTPLLTQGDKS